MRKPDGTLDIQTTVIYEYLQNSDKKITIFQGGSRSSKTYNTTLWFIVKLLNEKNKVLTICRASLPTMRGSIMRDFFDILNQMGIYNEKFHNKTENTYRIGSNLVEFVSTDDPQKIKGRRRDYLYVNEANEVPFASWTELSIRTSGKIVIDYNPNFSEYHWIFTELMPRCKDRSLNGKTYKADADFYITTYKDNPFLDPSIIAEIELLEFTDPVLWNIYGLGLPGTFQDLVYPSIQLVDNLPDEGEEFYGMDFGFTGAMALVRIKLIKNAAYIQQVIYSKRIITSDAIALMREANISPRSIIYGDSAAADSIEEVKRAGFNIKKSKKDIREGIMKVKSYQLFVTKDSHDVINEFRGYKWQAKPEGEKNWEDKPVKFNDHSMDALRYALFTHTTTKSIDWEAFKRVNRI